jgi:hypothetical protein
MRQPDELLRVEYHLAVIDGRPVVLEKHLDLPLIVHTFDVPRDAVEYYERIKGERLPEGKRLSLLMTAAAADGRA